MNALIYLRIQEPRMTGEDLDHLAALRRYAKDAGYRILEAWPVYDPDDAEEPAKQWYDARQDLLEGAFDVIVHWHADLGAPDTLTRDDVS